MLKWLMPYYKEYRKLFAFDMACAFMLAGLDLVFPILSAWLLDDIVPQKILRLLLLVGLLMAVLYFVRAFFEYIVDYWGHVLGKRMEYGMRRDFFIHLQKLPVKFYDENRTGHIMSRAVNDLEQISELAHHAPEDLFSAAMILIGALIIMLNMHWQLALIVFSLVPIMIFFAIKKNGRMRAAFRQTRLKIADVNAQLEDSIGGVRVVKSFIMEEHEKKKFDSFSRAYTAALEKAIKLMGEFYAGVNLFSNLINLAVIVGGGYYIYKGSLTMGVFLAFLLYVNMFFAPIRRIVMLMENLQKGMAGIKRFEEVMTLKPEIEDDPDAVVLKSSAGDIVFRDVTFSYDENKKVLSHLDFHIRPGETVALVGPSGAGKTTLCNLIPRFYEVQEGSIYLDGFDIRKLTQYSLRAHIGIVEQNVFLFSGTVFDNIAYGKADATIDEIIEAAKKANAHDFIMSLSDGYDSEIGERGIRLSGGQKQRLSIARVFLKNPAVLILDEATSALDTETEQIVQEALFKLSENRTTLVIAHRLSTIKRAKRIMVLTEEGIEETGSHEELMAKGGLYRKLYEAQFAKGAE